MYKRLLGWLTALLLISTPVWALEAIEGVYNIDGTDMLHVTALNAETMCVYANGSPYNLPDTYVLIANGRRWYVGRNQAGDMQAWDIIPWLARQWLPKSVDDVEVYFTGENKTVGAFAGAVCKYRAADEEGEMVLSDDRRVLLVSMGFTTVFQDFIAMVFGNGEGLQPIVEQANLKAGKTFGLLAFDEMRLVSISACEVPADFFTLPDVIIVDEPAFWKGF